ncbi:MAG: hypothetical protein ACE141_17420 [Bryobacteraceae bacterium]
MGIVGISEFSFGYAFLYEQTQAQWQNLRAAPILPSLQAERDQGWDAQLPLNGTDFYYQFKITDYLQRRNAKYMTDGTYDGPYYRFPLYRKNGSRQHRRLFAHAQVNTDTYYVSPEFADADTFNAAFLAGGITASCRLIPVRDTTDIDDDDQHYITFREGIPEWNQHSKRHRGNFSVSGGSIESVYRETARRWRPIDERFAVELFHKTVSMSSEILAGETAGRAESRTLFDFHVEDQSRSATLRRVSEILSSVLGATLVIVGAP